MHFLILRAIETCRCQISADETQASYGLSVLPDEEDCVCSPCSTRDSMQVRLDFLSQLIRLRSGITPADQTHHDAICMAAHCLCDVLPCGLALPSVVLHSQCARREITCEYPKESKRGQYRRQQYLERVGKEVAEKIAEVERLAADVEHSGGEATEARGHVGSGRPVGGRNRRLSSASQPY